MAHPTMWREMISDMITTTSEQQKITIHEDLYLHHNNLIIQGLQNYKKNFMEILPETDDIFEDLMDIFKEYPNNSKDIQHVFYYIGYKNLTYNIYDISIVICDRKKTNDKFVLDVYRFIYNELQSDNTTHNTTHNPMVMIK